MPNSADSRIDYRFVVPIGLVLIAISTVRLSSIGDNSPGVRHLPQVAVWLATVLVLWKRSGLDGRTFRAALTLIALFACVSHFDYGRFQIGIVDL